MKLSALLSRSKGRDFYDAMFLLAQSEPDYAYLAAKHGIKNKQELISTLIALTRKVDINHKVKDFEHLLFYPDEQKRILSFASFVKGMK